MTAAVRQFAVAQTTGTAGVNDLAVTFPSATLAGSTIVGFSRAAIDGQAYPITRIVSDAGGATFTTLETQRDIAGAVNCHQILSYAPNVSAGLTTFHGEWKNLATDAFSVFGDFRWVFIVEVTGVTATPLIGNHSDVSSSSAAGTDNITSGLINVTSQPALIVGVTSNESQVNSPFTPGNTGTGFTNLSTFANFGGTPDFSRAEYKRTTTTGNQAALFSATVADENFTFAIALAEASAGGSTINATLLDSLDASISTSTVTQTANAVQVEGKDALSIAANSTVGRALDGALTDGADASISTGTAAVATTGALLDPADVLTVASAAGAAAAIIVPEGANALASTVSAAISSTIGIWDSADASSAVLMSLPPSGQASAARTFIASRRLRIFIGSRG